ncbi:MAG: hypothetical protein JAY90_04235 [Candidatus Thiodiazotropha lotti]|nr:hypothetical protein [Candidatus Thiodiazotropha lotti]
MIPSGDSIGPTAVMGLSREINQPDLEDRMTEEQSLTDLENLVLAEIASASSGGRRRNRTENLSRSVEKQVKDGSVEFHDGSNEVSRIHGEDRDYRSMSGEEAELLQQSEVIDEPVDELPPNKLFSAEEEAFMHRAVGFLSGRENGDVILGRIWEQLTESQPDHYFEVPHGVSESPSEPDQPARTEDGLDDPPESQKTGLD